MNNYIKVLFFSRDFKNNRPLISEKTIENNSKGYRSLLKCSFVDMFHLSKDIVCVCNDNGLIEQKPVIAYLSDAFRLQDICGEFFLCSDVGGVLSDVPNKKLPYSVILKNGGVFPVLCFDYGK